MADNGQCGDAERMARLERVRQGADIARELLRAGGVPRKPCVLAPWDEMGYFDLPVVSFFQLASGVPQSIAKSNPRRSVLLFNGQSSLGPPAIFVGPDVTQLLGNTAGIGIGNTTLPLIFTQAQHGILCQVEWFGLTNTGPTNVVVIEVFLREWPGQSKSNGSMDTNRQSGE